MSKPGWLDAEIVRDFHAEQSARFGGPDGVRDAGRLQSALARPIDKFASAAIGLAVASGEAPGIAP